MTTAPAWATPRRTWGDEVEPPPAWGVTRVFPAEVLVPPDKVRAEVAKIRKGAPAWVVWTALIPDAGTKGRPWVLLVAYRGAELVTWTWEQDARLEWKALKGSHWSGRRAVGGLQSMTALKKIIYSET